MTGATKQGPAPPWPASNGPPDPAQRGAGGTGHNAGRPTRQPGDEQQPPAFGQRLRSWGFWLVLLAILLVNWLVLPALFPATNDRLTVSYTLFREQVDAGNVVDITSQGMTLEGTFKQPVRDPAGTEQYTKFTTTIPDFVDKDSLGRLLETKGISLIAKPASQPSSTLLNLLLTFGPVILLIVAFSWLSGRAGRATGGLFSFGRSRARRYDAGANETVVTFGDVAGIDEVKAELVEIVDFLKMPAKYQRLGGTMPKGVLLVGPPGTGKTLLARAVAGEANVPFFTMSGSEFIEMIVGVGASRMRDLFAQAKQAAPAIIFVDELDAIGRKRGAGNIMGGNDEREQTLNQLLVEMDGFDSRQGVIVLAATNRPDVLDPALLRPGRFDRRVVIQPPDRPGRAAILTVHTRGVPLAADVDLGAIAAETPGLVGADLRNLVNEAALLAARQDHDAVTRADFVTALEKIALGLVRHVALTPQERERVAYHEAGHALVGLLQPGGDPVRRVTIIPRGQALGVTLAVPEADRYNYSEAYLRARIISALGGRAAEELIYGTVTTGAENDLRQVGDLARAMSTRWGMSPEIGPLALAGPEEGNFLEEGLAPGQARPYSEATAELVDIATRRIVHECYEQALDLLRHERGRLEALAAALLRQESLDEAEIRLVTGLNAPARSESPVAVGR